FLQLFQQRLHVRVFRQARGERLLVDRLGRREQKRLERAQGFVHVHGGRRRGNYLFLRHGVFVFRCRVREFEFLSPKGGHEFFSPFMVRCSRRRSQRGENASSC